MWLVKLRTMWSPKGLSLEIIVDRLQPCAPPPLLTPWKAKQHQLAVCILRGGALRV